MIGPIFVSHSSTDGSEASSLALALRQAFGQRIRTFNTSSNTAIQAGDKWRQVIVDAIRDASLVILWCTPAAVNSKEVAFEIGAAFAFGKRIIPCAVHLPPSRLPWSLSEFHAPALDTTAGWINLAQAVANALDDVGKIDESPLIELASKFTAPSDALNVKAVGRTVEFRNISNAPITDIRVVSVEGPHPTWAGVIEGGSLQAGQGKTILRQPPQDDQEFTLTWTDVSGGTHRRQVSIGGITS